MVMDIVMPFYGGYVRDVFLQEDITVVGVAWLVIPLLPPLTLVPLPYAQSSPPASLFRVQPRARPLPLKPRHNSRYVSSELSWLMRLLKITTYGS
jgi:hypothetical protein